jgi:ectoine hydroxylase-related dioxygenase (phytanoyl-CoA dioxygenase family)
MQLQKSVRVRDSNRRFAEQGYAVIEDFLPRDALATLRGAVDRAVQRPPMAGCERPHNRLVPLRWNDPSVDIVLGHRERRRRIATSVGGDDLRWISGYISIKHARSPALWWHQDWWCWDHPVSLRPAPTQVALLCYLSDTHERSGALRVLPGSHRRSVALHSALPAAHAQGAALAEDHAVLSDQPGQLTLSARGGDAVALDYRLLHGTHANRSDKRRDCVLLSFTPSWHELPADLRAHLIQHVAQPVSGERLLPTPWREELLPSFDGVPADLELNRTAPAHFAVHA